MNSFRFIERGIHAEIARQEAILRAGGQVVQETLHFDPRTEAITSLRSKEEAHDYRYFPEPDLVAGRDHARRCSTRARAALPELPAARAERFAGPRAHRRDTRASSPGAPSSATTSRPRWRPTAPTRAAAGQLGLQRARRARRRARTRRSRRSRRTRSPSSSRSSAGKARHAGQRAGRARPARRRRRRPGGDRRGRGPRRDGRRRRRAGRRSSTPRWPPTPTPPRRSARGNMKAIGAIIGHVMRETKGRADGGEVTRIVREKLGRLTAAPTRRARQPRPRQGGRMSAHPHGPHRPLDARRVDAPTTRPPSRPPSRRSARELDRGYLAMVSTGPGHAEQVRELPVDADARDPAPADRRRLSARQPARRRAAARASCPRPRPSTGARASTTRACAASARLWTLTTVAHVVPFVGAGALLMLARAARAAGRARVPRARLGHPRALRPARRERRAPARRRARRAGRAARRSACSATSSATTRASCTPRRASCVEPGRLGTWLVGEAGALLRAPGGARTAGACGSTSRVADASELPSGDRIAHLLLALRTDEQGFATVANLAFSGARWRVRRRLAAADAPGARRRRGRCRTRGPQARRRELCDTRANAASGRVARHASVPCPPPPISPAASSCRRRGQQHTAATPRVRRYKMARTAPVSRADPHDRPLRAPAPQLRLTHSRPRTRPRSRRRGTLEGMSTLHTFRLLAPRQAGARGRRPRSSRPGSSSRSSIGIVAGWSTVVVVIVAIVAVIWAIRVLL